MEKDKKENVKHFNLKWFNKKNIDLVDDKIEVYISNLLDIDEYIEIGPGKALTGFIKKDIKEAKTYNINNIETLENYLKEEI